MELSAFITFVRAKLRPAGGRAALFPRFGPQDRAIHIRAEQAWRLSGVVSGDGPDDPPREIYLPLPKGTYTFDFPARSENLTYIVIDPDPGGGEPI